MASTPVQGSVAVPVGSQRSPRANKFAEGIDKIGIAPGFPTKCLAILIASIWVIAAASYVWFGNTGYNAYAIAVGSVGLVCSLLALLMLKFSPDVMSKELFKVKDSAVNVQQLLAGFLVIWFLIGAGVCTFDAPFTSTTNGYFGVWGGLIASLLALADCQEAVREKLSQNLSTVKGTATGQSIGSASLGLCLSSIVVLIACAIGVGNGARGEPIFGLVTSIVTLLVTVVFIFANGLEEKQPNLIDVIVFIFLILWIACTGVLTFRYFIVTSNGFFGAYAALFFCFKLFGIRFLN